jgi:hypothetical protein
VDVLEIGRKKIWIKAFNPDDLTQYKNKLLCLHIVGEKDVKSLLHAIWLAVVEFIEWYNKQCK